jgi:signal transduction histidine kinase
MIANAEWLSAAREALAPALHVALALEHASMGALMLKDGRGAWEPVAVAGLTQAQAGALSQELRAAALFETPDDGHLFLADATLSHGPARQLRGVAQMIGFRGADIVALHTRDDGVIGVVAALYRGQRQQSSRAAHLAHELCEVVACALHNARMSANAERRRMAAEHGARARLQFLAKVCHELRAPLHSVTGYLELLRIGVPDRPTARQRVILDRISASERVLFGVVDDLKDVARAEAGQFTYKNGPIAAAALMEEARTVVAPLARQLQVTLMGAAPHEALRVRADERKAVQVLVNLLTNAVKASRAGGMVRMHCWADGRVVHFDVVDEGPGIPPDKLAAVFEPYVQLETSANPDGVVGHGLGLTIARELAVGMGGTVSAASTMREGSTFSLTLPQFAPAPDKAP